MGIEEWKIYTYNLKFYLFNENPQTAFSNWITMLKVINESFRCALVIGKGD